MDTLAQRSCIAVKRGDPPISQNAVKDLLTQLKGWTLQDNQSIRKNYGFNNYFETMAFVNAVAWIAHKEDHHPDLQVSYNNCAVIYTTHAVNGLSENDFICAAKIDALFRPGITR